MGEKNRELRAASASEEDLRSLAERMRSVHISRIREMPRIELYLDQLLTLVSQELEFMQVPGETLVTGSMVNNYVKQGVIPAPRKKRYTRRHVASLLFVCALKRVFSISQVSQLAALIWSSELDLEAVSITTTDDDVAALVAMLVVALVSWLVVIVAYVVALVVSWARAIQIYVMAAFSPIPLALVSLDETRQMGVGYLKNFAAVCLHRRRAVLRASVPRDVRAPDPLAREERSVGARHPGRVIRMDTSARSP